MNQSVVSGNLTHEPELMFTRGGKNYVKFDIAHNRNYQQDGEWKQETSFFKVVVWNRAAEWFCNHAHKGQEVVAFGQLKQEQWEDKQTGQNRSQVVIMAREVKLIVKTGKSEQRGPAPSASEAATAQGKAYQDRTGGQAPQQRPLPPAPPLRTYEGDMDESDIPF